jgi:hypothetical protein
MSRSASPSNAIPVDVGAIGFDRHGHDVGAQLVQHLRRHLVSGAMGAIDDDFQTVEAKPAREGVLDEFDIAARCIFETPGTAEMMRPGEMIAEAVIHQAFNLSLDLVGQFIAIGAE